LLGVPKDEFDLFFFPGSASLQFSAIPYNLLGGYNGKTKAHYLTTGLWSECARREAAKLCTVIEVWPGDYLQDKKYKTIPEPSRWNISNDSRKDSAYFHYCENETVDGVEFPAMYPFYDHIPESLRLISDMSSNIATRKIDWDSLDYVYAGL